MFRLPEINQNTSDIKSDSYHNSITKELILQHVTQERIFEHYTGVEVKKGAFRSPFRKDRKASCSFSKKHGILTLTDFRGDFKGDCFDAVKHINSCNYNEALKIVANDFNIVRDESLPITTPKIKKYSNNTVEERTSTIIQVTTKEFSVEDLAWWARIGVSKETLNKGLVFNIDTVYINHKRYSESYKGNPVYGYYLGKVDGVQQWKIYFPFRKEHRFVMNTTLLQGAHLLPNTGEILVITKSMKDVLVLHELGIPAIAPQSESVTLSEDIYNRLRKRFKRIVMLYDNDMAGIKAMIKARKQFPCICLMCSKYGNKSEKDLSDCMITHGIDKVSTIVNRIKDDIIKGNYDKKVKLYA